MNILFVTTTLDKGGAEQLLLEIIRSLHLTHHIEVLYFKGEGTLVSDLQELGIEAIRFKPGSLADLAALPRKISGVFRGRDHTVVQGWMYHGNMLALLLHKLYPKRSKLYWGIHHSAYDYTPGLNKNYLLLRLSALLSGIPAQNVFVADHSKAEHLHRGYTKANSITIFNGVDPEKFAFRVEAREAIRKELGIPSDSFVIGAVGRNHPVKDYSTFFKAVKILIGRYPDLHVIVAGRGFDLSNFADELGSMAEDDSARIHLLGERADVPQVISALDLLVLTSISESFSLAVLEALSTERCCVCTDIVWIKDDFPKAIKTFVPGHYEELVKLVESFISMPAEARSRIAKEARNVLRSKYTLNNTIASYESMWQQGEVVIPQKVKTKKIIRLISRLNIGGPVIHVTLLNKHFNNRKYSSTLVTGIHSENEGDMSYLASQYNVEPIVLKGLGREISPLDDLKVLFQLIWLFLRERPDIVHTHTAKAGTLGRLAAFITRVPQVYHTFHGHVFEGYFSPLKTRIFIMIERFLALCSTGIIAISKQQKKDLVRFKIAPAQKISVVPLGFDFGRILPVDPESCLRKELNIPEHKIVVAIIGRITQIKNHALFFRIAYEVLKLTDKVHFLVVGDGELRQHYESEAQRLKIAQHVSFTGFITDLKLIYGSVDMVVLTSLNEGTPVSLLEAMACRKIVLTTKVGGVSDFIENGVNGFYFDFDADKFRDVILDYVANPARYAAIGARAADDILRGYNKGRLFADLESLYSKV